MTERELTKRTVLPPAEAEGAGNFGSEPGLDPTPSGGDLDVAVRSETGMLTEPSNPSPAGDIGNLTGGDPPEDVQARQTGDTPYEESTAQDLPGRSMPEDLSTSDT